MYQYSDWLKMKLSWSLTRWASRAGLWEQGLLIVGDSVQDCCQPVLQCPVDMPEETVQVL